MDSPTQILLEQIGGPGYVTGLTRRVASSAHIESHARIIAEKYYARQMIKRASEMIEMAYSNEDTEILSNSWRRNGDELENVFITPRKTRLNVSVRPRGIKPSTRD